MGIFSKPGENLVIFPKSGKANKPDESLVISSKPGNFGQNLIKEET